MAAKAPGSSVRFVGRLDHADLLEELGLADVVIVPSIWPENEPVIIMEAIAAGAAVIASRIGGNLELIQEGVSGLFVEPANAESLTKAMVELIERPATIEEFSRYNKGRIASMSELASIDRLEQILQLPATEGPMSSPIIVVRDDSPNSEVSRSYLEKLDASVKNIRFIWHEWADADVWNEAKAFWCPDPAAQFETNSHREAGRRGLPILAARGSVSEKLAKLVPGFFLHNAGSRFSPLTWSIWCIPSQKDLSRAILRCSACPIRLVHAPAMLSRLARIAPMPSALRIHIANERFLSRFGVDRILLMAAEFFRNKGHHVSLRALRVDPSLAKHVADHVSIIGNTSGLDHAKIEDWVADYEIADWVGDRPDILIVGGWPFFQLAARSPSLGVPSLFIDAGVVPQDGMDEGARAVQLELRRIRATTLPYISAICPISEFIRRSQTESDRGSSSDIGTVLLGSDHLRSAMPAIRETDSALEFGKKAGETVILNLGRFETRNYKNSGAIFRIVREVRSEVPSIKLLILANKDEIDIPDDLCDVIELVGWLSDFDLVRVMKQCDMGLSVSLWEGFNLPLVEMQNIGKPVLALNAGAHPEVIADPWFLCRDETEMTKKAIVLARKNAPTRSLKFLSEFERRLPWADTLSKWSDTVNQLAASRVARCLGTARRMIIADVTNTSVDTGNSGIVRVTRQLLARLQGDPALEVVCVEWHHHRSQYGLVGILHASCHLRSIRRSSRYIRVGSRRQLQVGCRRSPDRKALPDPRAARRPLCCFSPRDRA